MKLIPEGQKPRESCLAEGARLEQLLQDLSNQYLQRCVETPPRDPEYASMAKLYAGTKRLHQAVEEGAVAEAIAEIGSNLMGCEQMALMVTQGKGNKITLIGSVGLSPKQLSSMRINASAIMEEAPADTIYMKSDGEKPSPLLSSLGITAFVPFWLDHTTRGAIVFFDLLPQRNGLDSTDRELLRLLGAYVGPCLSAGKGTGQETFG
jgi:hypothetical protein